MSDRDAELETELQARVAARKEKVAGLRAALSAQQRAQFEKLMAGRAGAAPAQATIRQRPPAEPAVLSFAQQRLWFFDRLQPESALYNLPAALQLTGRMDLPVLARSLGEIVRRHEVLRTVFVMIEEEPRPVVRSARPLSLPVVDLARLPAAEREEEARRLRVAEALRPFDLARGPLLRVTLLRLGDADWVALFNLHHVVGDGWSFGLLVGELVALYRAFARGAESPLLDLALQYADFAAWQRDRLQGEFLVAELAHWRREIDGAPVLLELPTDRPRPAVQSFRGEELAFTLPRPLSAALAVLAEGEGATLFMVLLAGFQALLGRLTGQDDLLVGSALANRTHREIEGLIGFFINLLVFRARLSGEPGFRQLLARVRTTALAAYAHQDLPFDKLVEELRLARSPAHNPLVQAVLVLQNAPRETLELPGLVLRQLELPVATAKFDLGLTVIESGDELHCQLEYASDLFDRSTVVRLAGHFERLLRGVVEQPERRLAEIPLLAAAERHQLLVEWNSGPPVPPRQAVHVQLAAHASRQPEALALLHEGAALSYGELARSARRLARFLSGRGVGPGSLVGLCLERSLDLVVAILGVLEAGAAYVPLDPGYPRERLVFALEDSGISILLTTSGLAASLPRPPGLAIVDLSAERQRIAGESAEPLPVRASPEDLAYVIYTSGSTGRPKGVGVRHGEVSRLLAATDPWFGFGPTDIWTLFHSYAFDFSVWELWGALAHGGRLVVVPYGSSRSPEEFRELLWRERVTVLSQTPSAFQPLIQAEEAALARGAGDLALRLVIFGGEALEVQSLAPWWERHGDRHPRLVNMYGITETTVHVTYRALDRRDLASSGSVIGRPLPDLAIHLLDAGGEVVPVGVAGELHVGGAGLALGYLGRPELTARRFVPDRWSGRPGARLYRSGDLARYLADGDLLYLGRLDDQVKVRGFRIELGEIEVVLSGHPAVRQAVVLMREDRPGDPRLVAYVVGGNGENLRGYLRERLPDYMVPSTIVGLAALPLTANGKLDRRALPAPDGGEDEAVGAAPRTAAEKRMAGLWSQLLGVAAERIGVDSNFFNLGGHSLLATRLLSRMREAFGVELPLLAMFEAPTLAGFVGLAERELARGSEPYPKPLPPPLVPARRTGPPRLSFAQERLWFLDRLQPESPFYNLPMVLGFAGRLDVAALGWSLSEIVRRHEALRTTFRTSDGEPCQIVSPARRVPVPVVDLAGVPPLPRAAEARRLAVAESFRPFDLTSGPLLRTTLLRLAADDGLALFNLHHIVGDGWSIGILVNELAHFYRAGVSGEEPSLPELPIQYADFATWQRQWLAGEVLARELAHWRRELDGAPDLLELPADRPRPLVQSFRGGELRFVLPRPLSEALNAFAAAEGATLFMVLLAGFLALLGRFTGQEDLLVGSATANRNQPQIEPLIGFFVNLLALRGRLGGVPSGRDLLARTKSTALAAFAHQDLPFEKLVEELGLARSHSHNPLVQALLVLQNAPREALELPGLTLHPAAAALVTTAKFDLELAVTESGGELYGQLGYASDLFDRSTIVRLAGHLERLFKSVVEQPAGRLAEIPLLAAAERHQLQVEWGVGEGLWEEEGAVWEGFERQARRQPEAVALALAGTAEASLTYGELAFRAQRWAGRLRRLGVGPEARVGLFCERSFDLAVAILGIWQAGGAYLPLDPGLPDARLAFMIADALAGTGAVLVVQEALRARLLELPAGSLEGVRVVYLEAGGDRQARDGRDDRDERDEREAPPPSRPGDLAYLIYTSGTTGVPKAVAVEQGSLSHTLWATREAFGFRAADRMPCLAPFSFDIFLFELLAPLLAGGTVVLFPLRPTLDVQELAAALPGMTALHAVPAVMREVCAAVERGPGTVRSLRLAFVGGEAVPPDLLAGMGRVFPAARRVVLYGPTEGTILATRHEVGEGTAAIQQPIGRPLPGVELWVLGPGGAPVPIGVPGELQLGGRGVARGYLGRRELTAERFVPFPGGRGYRTGDRARFRPDGSLEFLGRVDHQVKVRGFRIELGEIEAVLAGHPAVQQALALVREDRAGDLRLVAYVVGGAGEDLKSYLRERLPDYMVPSAIVGLAALPLTANGKVDRKALPAPDEGEEKAVRAAPRTASEERMVGLWSQLLGVAAERIGVDSNFFELGGHSLLATRLVSRVREAFGVELPLRTVFEAPTVAGLTSLAERELAQSPEPQRTPIPPPLVPERRSGPLQLSFAQERLWFLDQLEPGSATYNIPLSLRLTGVLNVRALAASLATVIGRHEALRTTFPPGTEGPLQAIAPPRPAELPVVSLRALPEALRPAVAERLAREEAERPFDLERGPLVRGLLLRLEAESHLAVLNLHHIVADGWSLGILVREVGKGYTALVSGREPVLPALPIQYADYAIWQRRWLAGEALARQISWWQERLAGAPEVIELPTDRPRPPLAGSAGRLLAIELPPAVVAGVEELARESAATPFMVLLAAFALLLARVTGSRDLVVGSPIANRQRLETEGLIGLFINSLALRVEIPGRSTFGELLAAVRATTLGAYAHQDLPFEMVVEALAPARSLGYTPLFQVMLALQNAPVSPLELPGLRLVPHAIGGGRAKFDLTLNLAPDLTGTLEYREELFDRSTIERLAGGFERLLGAAVALPRSAVMPVADLPLLSAAERHQLQVEWGTAAGLERAPEALEPVWKTFEKQARQQPAAVALALGGGAEASLTYAELDLRASRLAGRLRRLGVGPEVRVGLFSERSFDLAVAILGIWKAGGAYLPLDPGLPGARLSFMIEDALSRAGSVLLAQESLRERLRDLPVDRLRVVFLEAERSDEHAAEGREDQDEEELFPSRPEHLAYLIYTSGTTGRPKAVAVEHGSLSHTLAATGEAFGFGAADRMPCLAPFSFDIFLFELLSPLLAGGTVVLFPLRPTIDVRELAAALPGTTALHAVPALMREVIEEVAALDGGRGRVLGLRLVFVGGDAVPPELVAGMRRVFPTARVVVLYGPTEGTILAARHESREGAQAARYPIGRPLRGTELRVFGPDGVTVLIGVPGELYVGGRGVARGYLGRQELTAEKFVPLDGGRWYRSGDLTRFRPDGSLEFLGRIDHQVKIRGFRIELGEVEAVLAAHPAVHQAVVLVREDRPGDRRLVAYAVGGSGEDLKAYLRERLPDYMVPAAIVGLAALPLTAHGKVDRKALPAPDGGEEKTVRVAPRTASEERMVGLWSQLLGVAAERIGVDANFFELGGHSLLATRLVSRVREAFGVELPLRTVFEAPTVAGLTSLAERELARGPEPNGTPLPPPLVPERRSGPPRLSFAQERLWFLDQLEPGSATYNIPLSLRLTGVLNVRALAASLATVIGRHEALRTTFPPGTEGPLQAIAPPRPAELPVVSLRALPEALRPAVAERLAREEAERPFDLERGPLVRGLLLRLEAESHLSVLNLHHIVADGWSMGILVREVGESYTALVAGRQPALAALPIQYADYAIWQRRWLAGEELARQISWWRERLAGAPEVIELPTDRPRPLFAGSAGRLVAIDLPAAVVAGVEELARESAVTPFMVLLAAFALLLARVTGSRDVVVGSPIANRQRLETEGLIGLFVNSLALRVEIPGRSTFGELLAAVRATTLGAYAHQDLPFEMVVEALAPARSLRYTPLFQVMLALQNAPVSPLELPGLRLAPHAIGGGRAKFDLTLDLAPGASLLAGTLEYREELFDRSTAARLAGGFERLLTAAVSLSRASGGDMPVADLPLLSAAERHQLAREWSAATASPSGAAPGVAELFASQVLRRPDAVALAGRGWQQSYGELAARSRRLARRLRALGVGPEVRVGIALGASSSRIEAILAVVQAAGAYVALDPDSPEERLAYALTDAAAPVLLTERALCARLPAISAISTATVICLDDAEQGESALPALPALPEDAAPASAGADLLAYVIYTSGSTGRPKGVEIPHRGLANLVRWHQETYSVSPEDRATLVASPGFDASVWEMWPYLASGASLYLVEPEARLSPAAMLRAWAEGGVSLSFLPTPLAEAVLEADTIGLSGTPLRALLTGGDRLHRGPAAGSPFLLANHYGPTEYSVVSTVQRVGTGAGIAPPIGRPIAGTRLAVVGPGGELVPMGVAGELYVGGAGLARGYLGRPDLTAERLVPDPLVVLGETSEPGARSYRTGDLVRWWADGSLEFLGRADDQVKIRGFRVELGEIEAVLAEHPEVLQAAVLAWEDRPGDRRLVAYVVLRASGGLSEISDISAGALRSHLQTRLPDFMLPASFVLLPALPLTANGKVDRRALPAPDFHRRGEGRVAPRTPAEELLADLWSGLLRIPEVGVDDNFFELGGHSLLATRVVSQVRELFGVEIPLRALFDAPTVAGLAGRLAAGAGEAPRPPLRPIPRPAPGEPELPLSFAQERLWFLDRLEPGGSVYNLGAAVRLVGLLDGAAFGAALGEVVRRHEALRTGFREGAAGLPVQVIEAWSPVGLPAVDLAALSVAGTREAVVRRLAGEEAGRPFDLSLGRPVRAALLRLGEREHVLLLTVHHIAADGWSVGVLIRELAALYEACRAGRPSPLPELPIQYADFAVWQRAWLSGAVLETQTAYWRQALGGAPTLELPTDRPRPAVRGLRGARRGLALSPGLSEDLRRFARGQGATAFMVLLTAFEALLGRLCGQEDLLVGSPIANRNHREIEGLIGFFVNTLVLRGDLSGDPDFPALVGRTREVTLGAYAHQDLPFEKLVEELAPIRDGSRTPLFQVMFTLQEAAGAAAPSGFGDLAAEWLEVEVETAKFDLTLSLGGGAGSGFVGGIEYSTELFDASTAMRLAGQFETLLAAIAAAPGRRLADLPLLSAAERHQLDVEWNAPPSVGGGMTLPARLAAQAARTPDAVAVVSGIAGIAGIAGEARLSYGELASRVVQVERHLRAQGVGPGMRVGLSLERSAELVIGLQGIVAAGGSYVPIDPAYPAERQDFMLADAGLAAVVNGEWLAALSEGPESPATGIGTVRGPGSADPLYVIYTSGSTGQPKGAVVRQDAFSGLVDWYVEELGLHAADRLLLLSSASFDLTQKNFFAPLLVGAELHLAPSAYDPAALLATIERQGITRLNCTPSAFYPLAEEGDPAALASLRSVILGGEPIATACLDRWRRSGSCRATVLNSYGPTECTDVVAFHRLAPPDGVEMGAGVPLGRPIPGVRIWIQSGIAGSGSEPAPIGAPGELWIGGECVGGGYVGDPARTAQKFLPDPSVQGQAQAPGARAYRTGDLARRLPGGEIDYLGRIDDQVKVRGFRIELGEIEAALAAQPGVREAAVVAREIHPDRPGDLRLEAYVVPAEGDGSRLEVAELRQALAGQLPSYMLPARFVRLAALPLTPSGKVDRRALAAAGLEDGTDGESAAFVAPRTPVEELLAGIWYELLNVPRVGARDDFFALGGHSLLATQLASRLRSAFGVEVPLRRIFEAPTLSGLAAEVAAARQGTAGGSGEPERVLLPVARGARLPLSFAQERLWFLERFDPGNPSLNIPLAAELAGRLSVPALAATLAELAARQESLRTTFETVAGEPSQKIHPAGPVALPEVDLAALPGEAARGEAERLAVEQALRGFDLERGPLYRAALVRLADDRHRFLLVLHHIITDGWSMAVLLRELGTIYEALSHGRRPSLPPLPIQYADYAVWQRLGLAGEKRSELDYWLTRLGGEAEPLELPTDRSRPAVQTYRGEHWPLALSVELTSRLRAFGRQKGVTLFMTLLTAANALLSRQSGQDDVRIGTPIAGRGRLETEGLIGFFLNTLVLRTDLSGNPSLSTLASRVRTVTLDAYAHQDIPFEAVLAGLKGERDLSRTPLFQVLFNLLNVPKGEIRLPGLTLLPLAGPESVPSKFDLTFYVTEQDEEIDIELVYNADLFDAARMADLADQYRGLLAQAVENPEVPLAALSLVTERARAVLPDPRSELGTAWVGAVHELFAAEARRSPERAAVSDGQGIWSYGELDAAADRLAGWLLAQGVAREDRVAIYAHRSAPLVPAVLAALKAGAAFTMLDPAYPAARLIDMLALASPRACLLVEAAGPLPAEVEAWFAAAGCPRLVLSRSAGFAGLPDFPAGRPAIAVGPDDLAYVAFTSGSTGAPKGILGRHGPLTHFLPFLRERFGLSAEDRFTLLSGLAHDPLQRDIFTPLCLGATILVPDPREIPVPGRVAAWMAREEATVAHLTPAMAQLITERPAESPAERPADGAATTTSSLRLVLLVGEALTRLDVARIRRLAPEVTSVNLFGSTETQRAVGYHRVTAEEASGSGRGQAVLALGRGMEDVQLLVLTPAGGIAGIGEVGEIVVRSPHLARGYLNDPVLTAEKFRGNPALGRAGPAGNAGNSGNFGERLYCTGDLGRYLPNGEVTFAGRGDSQIKIRGFRVEPAEIEAALARHPAVAAAAALLREERGERFLVALFVPRPGAEPPAADLREHLLSALPSYMVPAAFARLAALPLTPNGKLDRRALKHLVPALSRMVGEGSGAAYTAPRNAAEELLADLWAGLLGLDRVGIDDNFFGLGGHSLLATRLVSRVREVFGVELPVRALFDAPTLAGLAELLATGAGEAPPPPLRQVPRPVSGEPELPLSFAQERLWFLDRLAPGGSAYNISAAVRLTGPLDVAAFGAALGEVVCRHEALRTGFREGAAGQPVQVIAAWRSPDLPAVDLPVVDLSDLSGVSEEERDAAVLGLAREEAGRPFDLTSGRLVRAALLRLAAARHVVLLTLHHIAADGWSMGILVSELAALYAACRAGGPSPLMELPIQYADFAVWQREWLSGAALETQMAYWRRALAGAPTLDLPTDRPRPAVRGSRGALRAVALPPGLSADLWRLARRQGATPFMVLLAAFEVLLERQSGQEDLLVGSPIANRTHREIEGLIGFFVNTLVLRGDLSGDPGFLALLARTRDVTLGAYAHQDLPFEKLVSELAPVRDVSRTPLFQVMFNLQNAAPTAPGFPGLTAERLEIAGETAKFDLTLSLSGGGEGGFGGSIEYSTDLFDGTTIERLRGQLETLLEGIAANPAARLSDLPLLSGPERQALREWNATAATYPAADAGLHEWIAAQVRRTPDAVALVFVGEALSYGELAARAGLLARHLRRLGVGPEVTVGICLERSLELMVGLLAVLTAGGAYLPLDSTYPRERLARMLEDGRPPVVLATAQTVAVLPPHAGRTVLLDAPLPAGEASGMLPASVSTAALPENLAYVIFTSGSTGRPKGVMNTHRGIVNRLLWMQEEYRLGAADRVLQKTPASFDVSVWEFFWPLLAGGCLVMALPGGHQDPAYLARTLAEEEITTLHFVPAMLQAFLAEPETLRATALRQVMASGEALPATLSERFLSRFPGVALHNLYGPTEAAVDVTYWPCAAGEPVVPIGRPVANTVIRLLDARQRRVPAGVPGELWIGGVQLARGYLGRPALTAERFVPDPEAASGGSAEPGARLYRTGDLARHLAGGEIEYLGRIDHQVKVRGFRIELGEIEAALLADPGVSDAAVVAHERPDRPGELRLVAYVVPRSGTPELPALRAGLAGRLPYYMLPTAFVLLAALPLTPNGKVDRQGLPSPDLTPGEREESYEAPHAGIEERLAAVWVEVLGSRLGERGLGRHDNFFALGGDSLLAIRIVHRAREAGLVFTPLQLFERPTIAGLADLPEILGEPAPPAAAESETTPEAAIDGGTDLSGADFDPDDLARFLAGLTGD